MDQDAWSQAMAKQYETHTIICGLGKVSLKVAEWILTVLDDDVVIIEQSKENKLITEVEMIERRTGKRIPIIYGDARRREVLAAAGVRQAESIVPCTNDDLVNLSIALEARRMTQERGEGRLKVVLRMFDNDLARNIRTGFDIHTAYSIPEISAPIFAAAATRSPYDYALEFPRDTDDEPDMAEGDESLPRTTTYDETIDRVYITEFTVVAASNLVGWRIAQLKQEFKAAVLGHRRGETFHAHPPEDIILAANDRVMVSAKRDDLKRLGWLTPPSREMWHYLHDNWHIQPPNG